MTQNKEENHLIEERRKKLADLRASNNAFPNDFRRKNLAQELKDELDQFSKEELAIYFLASSTVSKTKLSTV